MLIILNAYYVTVTLYLFYVAPYGEDMEDDQEVKAPASRMKFAPLAREKGAEKKDTKAPKAKAKSKSSGEPGATQRRLRDPSPRLLGALHLY